MADRRELATVELLGALTYGQLRAFEVSARAIRDAPDVRTADRLAEHAVREHRRYAQLRDRLVGMTDLGGAVMDRQRHRFDEFFDHAPTDDWLGACTFLAVGLPIAADFCREIAPTLDAETATLIVDALADRADFERFALDQVAASLADEDLSQRVRSLVADILGRALTGYQGAVADSDALEILLGDDEAEGEALVRRVAITVIEGHRRRMHELGLEPLD